MPAKKHIPKEELEKLVKQGYELKHLAEHFNCDISTIKARLEEYQIPFEVRFAEKKEVPEEEIIRRIRQGRNYKEIAEELGVSYRTLLKRVKEYGIDYWSIRIPRNEFERLVNRGMSVSEIANFYNLSQSLKVTAIILEQFQVGILFAGPGRNLKK